MINYWLLKSEPSIFSVDDLARAPKQITAWEGVRNYQARNFMRSMAVDDLAFFYHSSCAEPGIVGIVKIVKAAYPDPSQFMQHCEYYDAKSTKDNPRWFVVDVKLIKKFPQLITLATLKTNPALKNMLILRKGNRLSVTPVAEREWEILGT